ncbi:MAG: inositol monophosphatase [Candidatus Riflebacteria bacterium]|nr:inositol monophosphatase [Candidatus Riflebacteria bacterium]
MRFSQQQLQKYLQSAIKAASAAGKEISSSFGGLFHVEKKGDINLVTETDLAAEKAIKEILLAETPEINFYGEEGGGSGWKETPTWVADPLDGTSNFAKGLPHFCVSIALCDKGLPIIGVIHQPLTNEVYTAVKGAGAFLNGKPLNVNDKTDLNDTLAATGFPYNRRSNLDLITSRVKNALAAAHDLRRLGSAALDLCFVARGIYGVYWEDSLMPWDVAAGMLIVEEAGGKISKFDGSIAYPDSKEILATNGLLHETAIEKIIFV